ncbi:unnamed protein product [Adineta ricciae]|uniref:C2H2-type domain-containing protein n=1 Tax=Adineta ricciae TaxID=249248 RepID=A0A815YT10_ADIRI|nr:unnamed protein product [Adineta ricciae]
MWQENQVTSSVSTPPDFQLNTFSLHQHQQQQQQQAQLHHHQGQQQAQQQQQQYYSSPQINDEHFNSYNLPSQTSQQSKSTDEQHSHKPTCTRCGTNRLIDITHHEFPKQKGLLYECMSCGNNSLHSNVSDDERQRRLAKVAADHLNITECQFCSQRFHSYQDYLKHLQSDHASQ